MRSQKPPSLLMVLQTMIFILPLSGKKMTALLRPEDVDVAEAHTEVATVVTVVSIIIMGNVEDIEEATMAVTVEDTEEVIVEDSVEATVEATEVASEASEVANEVESVGATVVVAMENGGVITMESVDEVDEAADGVIEEVVMDQVRLLQLLQLLHELRGPSLTPKLANSYLISTHCHSLLFLMILYCVNIVCTASLPCFFCFS